MIIWPIGNRYAGLLRDVLGGGWYATGRTRSEVVDILISRLVLAGL